MVLAGELIGINLSRFPALELEFQDGPNERVIQDEEQKSFRGICLWNCFEKKAPILVLLNLS